MKNMKNDTLDPFYRLRFHNGQRPRGIYFDLDCFPIKFWEMVWKSQFADTECRVALLCDLGEHPESWSGSLEEQGFFVTEVVSDPDSCTLPPYDGIRHVVGVTTLNNVIGLLNNSSGICAVRILSEREQISLEATKFAATLRAVSMRLEAGSSKKDRDAYLLIQSYKEETVVIASLPESTASKPKPQGRPYRL